MSGDVEKTFGGHTTLSGGSRTAVKTVRPWQVRMPCPETRERRADCPLCSRPQTDEHVLEEGWKTFANSNTPFPYHRLLVPSECWPQGDLWSLGGPETFAKMFRLAIAEVKRTRECLWPTWVFIHVGYGAGQNFPHLHWHLCGVPALTVSPSMDSDCPQLWETREFNIRLGGVRAGQTMFLPRSPYTETELLLEERFTRNVAEDAHRLIDLFNRRFKRPDYCLFFALHGPKDWHIRYTPILNNWGGSEFAALDYNTPFVLQWPHEATRDFLLTEEVK